MNTKRGSLLVEAEETSCQCRRGWPGTVLETSCSSLVPNSGVPTTSDSPRALGAKLLVAHGTCSWLPGMYTWLVRYLPKLEHKNGDM